MAIDTSAPRQQHASRRPGQGRSAAGSAADRKRVARFSRSAQMARRADPPGPLFHRAIWTTSGAGAGAGPGARAGAGSGARTGADLKARAGADSEAGSGARTGADAGAGADPGVGG